MTVLLILVCGYTRAAINPPADYNIVVNQSFDLGSAPTITLWSDKSGGYDTSDPSRWGRNSVVCFSQTDTVNGACPVSSGWLPPDSQRYVSLMFTLKGTNNRVNITGESATNFCGYNFPSTSGATCGGSEKFFTFVIRSNELKKLSTPGVWTATLKQRLMQWAPQQQLAVWQADITLQVSDVTKQTIYFPAFPSGNAAVNLNLNNRPGARNNTTVSGNSNLDMCLYDGGLTADNIVLIFQDEGKPAPGRIAGQFSVYRDGGNPAQPADRLDYVVQVLNPGTGSREEVSNGTQNNWANINARNAQRQVVLAGIPGISLCVPAPVTLITPSFILADKTAGRYSGKLRVIYTPRTSR